MSVAHSLWKTEGGWRDPRAVCVQGVTLGAGTRHSGHHGLFMGPGPRTKAASRSLEFDTRSAALSRNERTEGANVQVDLKT